MFFSETRCRDKEPVSCAGDLEPMLLELRIVVTFGVVVVIVVVDVSGTHR